MPVEQETREAYAERVKIVHVVNKTDETFERSFNGIFTKFRPQSVTPIRQEQAWLWFGDSRVKEKGTQRDWNREVILVAERTGGHSSGWMLALKAGKLFVHGWDHNLDLFAPKGEQPRVYENESIPLSEFFADGSLGNLDADALSAIGGMAGLKDLERRKRDLDQREAEASLRRESEGAAPLTEDTQARNVEGNRVTARRAKVDITDDTLKAVYK